MTAPTRATGERPQPDAGEPARDTIVLALESSGDMCSVAVASARAVLYEWSTMAPREHSQLLHPALAAALDAIGWSPAEAGRRLAGVGVTTGPGSFTGLRIGIAAAKGLSQAWGLPLAGAPTLMVMAAACGAAVWPAGPAAVIAAVPTRRGDCYAGLYVRVAPGPQAPFGWRQIGDTVAAPPGEALSTLLASAEEALAAPVAGAGPRGRVFLCGSPWRGAGGTASCELLPERFDWPLAKDLAQATAAAWPWQPGDAPERVLPVYVRRPGLAPGPEDRDG
jgi:tRNA threonylcarbamoyladenosine biosynthesis protein TsaB